MAPIEKERQRCREKYYRLNYREKRKSFNVASARTYRAKYPEIQRAHHACEKFTRPGLVIHHWSYQEYHTFIFDYLTPAEHYRIHTLLTYDPEFQLYRAKETRNGIDKGTLLLTRSNYERYIA